MHINLTIYVLLQETHQKLSTHSSPLGLEMEIYLSISSQRILGVMKMDNQLRSKLSSSSSPREGRLLLKLAARKLPGLILGAGILAGSAGTGTLSSTNSFNLFGKTINSALSLAYGDRGLVPPFVVPTYPVGGGLPIAPVGGGLPIAPVGGGLPLAPVGPGGPILPLPARAAVKTAEQSVPEQTKITTVNSVQRTEQIEGSIPNILDQYMQIERLREKLLIEPKKSVNDPVASNVNIVTESVSQKLLTDQLPTFSSQIRTDQTLTQLDERLKQFLKQHNDLVDELNNRMYVKVPTVKQF
ncbi:hypothetical protein L9F63_025918 [Diploptera punctata]|uniref:Uncharacterized protein n=1 Tax=Diploptera punctata TaxID=6984 RepID=A0AAD7Z5T2_DIPPU|nr:hypothetical protein L9F63_025918 [Diploptera punctata]